MSFTEKEQKVFEAMFWKVCSNKTNKEKLYALGNLLFELTGNVNLRMWLSGLEAELDKHRWRPVSERTPKVGKKVLAFNKHTSDYAVGEYENNNRWVNPVTGIGLFFVTHWKPIFLPNEKQPSGDGADD